MDVMELRRMVIEQMANWKRIEEGTFTVPENVNDFTLNYQNSFNKYFIIVEASSESKAVIINTQSETRKTFAVVAFYPKLSINNTDDNYNGLEQYIVPSSNTLAGSSLNIVQLTNSSCTLRARNINTSYNSCLYNGLTYNYTIWGI